MDNTDLINNPAQVVENDYSYFEAHMAYRNQGYGGQVYSGRSYVPKPTPTDEEEQKRKLQEREEQNKFEEVKLNLISKYAKYVLDIQRSEWVIYLDRYFGSGVGLYNFIQQITFSKWYEDIGHLMRDHDRNQNFLLSGIPRYFLEVSRFVYKAQKAKKVYNVIVKAQRLFREKKAVKEIADKKNIPANVVDIICDCLERDSKRRRLI